MERVRFEEIPIGCKCQTEYNEKIVKTEEIRIQTTGTINFRNAVNIDTGELLPIDLSQWVYVKKKPTQRI